MNRTDYEANPKLCLHCEKPILYRKRRGKFCDHSCSAKFNNKGVRRHGKSSSKCLYCGTDTRNKIYCSNTCRNEHVWGLKKEQILIEQKVEFSDCERCNRSIAKRYLIEINGHKCEKCGLSEWLGEPIPLVIDHKDGNANNNLLSNFWLVCGNCNMTLPTFAGRNKGNGTRKRREIVRGKVYSYNMGN